MQYSKPDYISLDVYNINGHNIIEIKKILKKCIKSKNRPSVVICHTVKGKGIKIAENNPSWHHKHLKDEDIDLMNESLK